MRRPAIGLLALAACGLYGAVALKAEDPIVPSITSHIIARFFSTAPRGFSTSRYRRVPRRGFTRTRRPSCTSTSRRREAARRIWAGVGHRRSAKASRQRRPAGAATSLPSAAASGPRVTSTTSYATQPVTHRLENIGERLSRAIVVINETSGDEITTVEAAGFEGKPELVNRRYRAYRQTLAVGEATRSHRHTEPVVIVQTSEGHGRASGAMKFELNEPGQWAFFDASDAH